MFEELKKRSFKSSLAGAIILMIIGLVLMGWNIISVWYAITGYAKFEELGAADIKNGKLVDIELDYHFGCYLEEYTTRSNSTRKTTTYLYYLIDTWPQNEYTYDDSVLMTVKVPASYEKQMENYDSEGYLRSIVSLSGKIKKLSSEDYSYFRQALKKAGFTDEEIAAETLPYYIDVYANKSIMNIVYILVFVGSLALFVAGILKIVKAANGGYLKKLREDILNAGYTESSIESDYQSAHSFDKKGTLRMGTLMTYYTSGAETRAIPNNKILWAYQNTVTHRTNGIKTGTTYNVILFAENAKNAYTLSVPNEATSQDMLQRINDKLPWVVVGYTDELKRLFNQDRAQFLQIRYNTCGHNVVEPGSENISIGIGPQH